MHVLWALTLVGAPTVLGRLVWLVFQSGDPRQTASYVEFFAGKKSITRAMRDSGRSAISFERDDDEHQEDFCSQAGFAYALRCILSLVDGGGVRVTSEGNPAHGGTGFRTGTWGVQTASFLW